MLEFCLVAIGALSIFGVLKFMLHHAILSQEHERRVRLWPRVEITDLEYREANSFIRKQILLIILYAIILVAIICVFLFRALF